MSTPLNSGSYYCKDCSVDLSGLDPRIHRTLNQKYDLHDEEGGILSTGW